MLLRTIVHEVNTQLKEVSLRAIVHVVNTQLKAVLLRTIVRGVNTQLELVSLANCKLMVLRSTLGVPGTWVLLRLRSFSTNTSRPNWDVYTSAVYHVLANSVWPKWPT